MSFLFMLLWVGSCIATVYLAMSFQLNGFVRLLLLNVLLPFSGFLYTLYICYYYLPRELAKRTGLPVPPGPFKLYVEPHLKPYSDKLRAAMWEKLKSLTSTEDQDKRL